MGKLLEMQPSLIHVPTKKDMVYTPEPLARDIVYSFAPSGKCLDPCRGAGVFYNLLPDGSDWCEAVDGRDFYTWVKPVDWIVGNPPYSHLLAWIRHSLTIASDIVYLIPLHRVFASAEFLDDLAEWGGVAHIRKYGTGTDWGFPFGHALAAVHYQSYSAGFRGVTTWSRYRLETAVSEVNA